MTLYVFTVFGWECKIPFIKQRWKNVASKSIFLPTCFATGQEKYQILACEIEKCSKYSQAIRRAEFIMQAGRGQNLWEYRMLKGDLSEAVHHEPRVLASDLNGINTEYLIHLNRFIFSGR